MEIIKKNDNRYSMQSTIHDEKRIRNMQVTISKETNPHARESACSARSSFDSKSFKSVSQWQLLMRKYSSDTRKLEPRCRLQDFMLADTVTCTKRVFTTGSSYEGSWDAFGMYGYGTYTYPNGAVYEGEFEENAFHGAGQLRFPDGTVIRGRWKYGELVDRTIVFADGIHYSKEDWTYCTPPDRRFSLEYHEGFRPSPNEYLTADQPTKEIPPGYYDAGDGFFQPETKSTFSYDDLATIIRTPDDKLCEWIVKNCRCSDCILRTGPIPEYYEEWVEPQLDKEDPPIPACISQTSFNEDVPCIELLPSSRRYSDGNFKYDPAVRRSRAWSICSRKSQVQTKDHE